MSAAKRKVMACLDLRPEYASLLTTDDRATNIQAVPLWMCSQKVTVMIWPVQLLRLDHNQPWTMPACVRKA